MLEERRVSFQQLIVEILIHTLRMPKASMVPHPLCCHC